MIYELPETLEVNGVEHPIRTDFRVIMRVLFAMGDPELEDKEKAFVCLYDIYEDFNDLKSDDYEAAFKAAIDFMDCGEKRSSEKTPSKGVVDFEQDERLLIAAVNRVAGCEVRSMDYLHWWTFMGYFMEIGECTYSTVLSLRSKKNKGKKLEKWEQEFWANNKNICEIREKLTAAEQEDYDLINSMI